MEEKALVLYHKACLDGIAAAWVFHHKDPCGYEYIAVEYSEAPPDVTGRKVYVVDFSFPRDVLIAMLEKAKHITIIDHHNGVVEKTKQIGVNEHKLFVLHNTKFSGSYLTHIHLNRGIPVPRFIKLIDDGDLYSFSDKKTKVFEAGLIGRGGLREDNRQNMFELFASLNQSTGIGMDFLYDTIYNDGIALIRSQSEEVIFQVERSKRYGLIGGHRVPIANVSRNLRNQAADLMNEGELFSVTYCDTATHREFSIRKRTGELNLSKVAEEYGGGGHSDAAAFKIKLEDPVSWELLLDPEYMKRDVSNRAVILP